MKDVKKLLAEEDERDTAAGVPMLHELSQNEFLVLGMDLEDEQ